jgi:hypothetical protein
LAWTAIFLLRIGRHNRTIKKSELKTKKQDQTIKESELKTNRHNRPIQKSELTTKKQDRTIKESELKTNRHNRPIQKSELKTKKQDRTIKVSELKTNRHNRPIQKSELGINRLYRPIQSEDRIGIGRSINRTFRPPLILSLSLSWRNLDYNTCCELYVNAYLVRSKSCEQVTRMQGFFRNLSKFFHNSWNKKASEGQNKRTSEEFYLWLLPK